MLNVQNGGDPASLDPHRVSGDWENRIVGDIFEGLVTEDIGAEPVPGQAESWEISEDGLTYTFTLRDGIAWSDGTPVTAEDFVFSLRRLMNPETAAQYAYLQYPISNAEAVNAGDMPVEELGVRAIDDTTLEITLERPTPYFIGALTHYTAYPIPSHAIEEHGEDWVQAENIVVNGPYRPLEWVPNSHVLTERNPEHWDAENVSIEGVRFVPGEDISASFKRYRAGEFDIMTDLPKDQFAWIEENLPGQARVSPFAGLYYYVMNHEVEPFDDVRVRTALSMAVNREVIGAQVLGTGEPPAFSWVPPNMAGYGEPETVEWMDAPYPERVEEAKSLLEEAGHGPDSPLELTLRYNTNDNHRRVAVAIASMWKPLGVEVELFNTETKVHYDDLRAGEFEVARAGWLADYNDADNFLNLLKGGVEFNYGNFENAEFDRLMDEANAAADSDERECACCTRPRSVALAESAAMPIYYYLSENIVSPKVQGFEDNAFDIHRTRWLTRSRSESGVRGAPPPPPDGRRRACSATRCGACCPRYPVLWIAITACFFVLQPRPRRAVRRRAAAARGGAGEPRRALRAGRSAPGAVLELPLRGAARETSVRRSRRRTSTSSEQLAIGLPYTLIVGGLAFVLAALVGTLAGILGALYRDRAADWVHRSASVLLGTRAAELPGRAHPAARPSGWSSAGCPWAAGVAEPSRTWCCPWTVLALPHVARISRLMRGALIETLNGPFIRTARAKGLEPRARC